jgi:hypothetical protein
VTEDPRELEAQVVQEAGELASEDLAAAGVGTGADR